ncbi:hypothetical protein OKW76_14790 [Sphingomonas sp. S1-29]|uniref:hypothetical protein n=1 Tax=Sphingomonas sp. S1-29 TaxID=2991074 RepID=UPI00223EAAF5|nr:hypothetical protein [Sphingomonas sp. S1-29]UZK69265.1 hypothetical protein OKW76_14790 [Sphingomonas sp. S1-29]
MLIRHFLLAAILMTAPASVAQPRQSAKDCKVSDIRSQQVATDAAASSIKIEVLAPDTLRLSSVEQFEGPCAANISAAFMGQLLLDDGTAGEQSADVPGTYIRRDSAPLFEDGYDRRTVAEKKLPRWRDTSPINSARVNAKLEGGDFVGVWRDGGVWGARSFTQHSDRRLSQSLQLFSSRLPIRDIRYFPSPDSSSGVLGILQEMPDGRVRTLNFQWWHRSAFSKNVW